MAHQLLGTNINLAYDQQSFGPPKKSAGEIPARSILVTKTVNLSPLQKSPATQCAFQS
jgi:hypothetical protein